MPKFGKRSKRELATAHPDLQRLFNEVIKIYDCSVICGHRGRAAQEKAYADGKSKVNWPKSKHNQTPSRAVDCAPWPSLYKDMDEFREMTDLIKATAKRLGIKIRCGIDWKWKDPPHVELI